MLSRKIVFAPVLCAGVVVAAGFAGELTPPAGPVSPTLKALTDVEPRTAINAANTPGDSDSVIRIAVSGSYYLTGNVTSPLGKAGIEIAASDVSIDLNGFTISGDGVGRGITASGPVSSVSISNGTVRSTTGGDGIDLLGASDVRLERVVAHSNTFGGIAVGVRSTVKSCIAASNGTLGISAGAGSLVEDCQALDNAGGHGISVGGGCRVVNCTARNNGIGAAPDFGGINVVAGANDGLIEGCFVTGNDRGIIVNGTGWTVIRNIARSNAGPEFSIVPGNFEGATVSDPSLAVPMGNIAN